MAPLHLHYRMTMKISVIVPVYNAERYIASCIESILSQTHQEIEVLLVDDGSKDRSGEICDAYADKDSRVRVVHQNNGGELAARAAGVRHSTSELLYFVDADDAIAPNTLVSMLRWMDEGVDIVVYEYKVNACYDKIAYAQNLLSFSMWTVWGKLYRRRLFDEDVMNISRYFKVGGDFLTQLKLLKNIKGKVICKPIFKYDYNTSNPNSVQLDLKHTYEYERRMMCEVESILKSLSWHDKIAHAHFNWNIKYFCGFMGLGYPIDYQDDWVKELANQSIKLDLNIREYVAIKAIKHPSLRYVFVAETHLRCIARKIRRSCLGK